MSAKRAQILSMALAMIVVVGLFAAPLCVATACTTASHASAMPSGCSEAQAPQMQSCSHAMQSLALPATAQTAPTFEAHATASARVLIPTIGSEHSVTVALADEPPRTPLISRLRI